MTSRMITSVLLAAAFCLPAAAQEKRQVDWEAKALTWELQQLGDPEINVLLPELYRALADSRREQGGESSDASSGPRKLVPPAPSMMSLLSNPDVRQEIGMLDSQYEEIQAKNQELQRRTNDQVLSLLLSAKDASIDRQVVREKIQEIRENAQREIEKTVLPFQFKRLRQIAYQAEMRRRGVLPVLTTDPLASELGITDDQKEKLTEAAKEIEEELAREIAKLRAQARDKLFARLRSDQRKKLAEIMGEEFEFQEAAPPGGKRKAAGAAKMK